MFAYSRLEAGTAMYYESAKVVIAENRLRSS